MAQTMLPALSITMKWVVSEFSVGSSAPVELRGVDDSRTLLERAERLSLEKTFGSARRDPECLRNLRRRSGRSLATRGRPVRSWQGSWRWCSTSPWARGFQGQQDGGATGNRRGSGVDVVGFVILLQWGEFAGAIVFKILLCKGATAFLGGGDEFASDFPW